MKLPSLQRVGELYNARVMRERLLIVAAVLTLVLALWDSLLMQPLRLESGALQTELESLSMDPGRAAADNDDPHQIALRRAGELQLQSGNLDRQIAGSASGFVPAEQMIQVLHDVLRKQSHLSLVSIRNLPLRSLIPPAEGTGPGTAPYVHSIELVIDGPYADVQAYVQALEELPWKFRWTVLELTTRDYPVNRVRLELSTLSMDATWLGV